MSSDVEGWHSNRKSPSAGRNTVLVCVLLSCLLSLVPDLAEAKSKGACPFGDGQRIGAGQCLVLQPRQASEAPDVDQAGLSEAALRKFCPNLVSRKRDREGRLHDVTIELPPRAQLYDVSDCCPETSFTLTTEPARHRFTLLGVGRDCFGGTAHFAVEETYRLDKDGKASLMRRLDKSDTEWKLPTEP